MERKENIRIIVLDSFVKEHLQNWSNEMERASRIEGLSHTLHFTLMELIANAVKANLKRLYFKQNNLDLHNPEHYRNHLQEFKKAYEHMQSSDYENALEEMDFRIDLESDLNKDRLLIHVENNSLLHTEEEIRIRRQLAAASDTLNIVEYSVHYGDETEGKGLGLAMVVLLIRDLGFDTDNFRIFQDDGKTRVRLEFPLHADYIPIRQKYKSQQGL